MKTSVYMRTYPEENPTITHVQSGPPCVLLKDKHAVMLLGSRLYV